MYKYENAEMEIVVFASEDVITTSSGSVVDPTETTEALPKDWLPIA